MMNHPVEVMIAVLNQSQKMRERREEGEHERGVEAEIAGSMDLEERTRMKCQRSGLSKDLRRR